MAHAHSTSESAEPVTLPQFDMRRAGILPTIFFLLAVVGVLGSALWLGYGLMNPDSFELKHFSFAALWGCFVCHTILAGCLFWVLLHHAVDANWSVVARRTFETVAKQYWVVGLAIASIIVLLGPAELYKWMKVEPGQDVVLDQKRWYLNDGGTGLITMPVPAPPDHVPEPIRSIYAAFQIIVFPNFYARLALFIAFFAGAAWVMRWMSLSQDNDGHPKWTLSMRHWSNPFIFLFGISISLSAVDWFKSLDYHWYSTMWGVYIFAGSALTSMAVVILITNALKEQGFLEGVMTVEHNHIMGKLLFAFTVFWAYVSFSQFMLIWYANIPEETGFYYLRNTNGWYYVSWSLTLLHFLLPFLWLITQPAKRTPWRLKAGAILLIVMHLVDTYWVIIPQFQFNQVLAMQGHTAALVTPLVKMSALEMQAVTPNFFNLWKELLPLAGLVGVIGLLVLRDFERGKHVFPIRDPRLRECITLTN